MKTFVLTVSRVFPLTHKRKGESTFFEGKLILGQKQYGNRNNLSEENISLAEFMLGCNQFPKIHTIRANYELWKKRIEQVQKGEAILSIRYWSDKPYKSKQVEICQLDKDSGIGVQKFKVNEFIDSFIDEKQFGFDGLDIIAKNDGLSFMDFDDWFKKYDFSKPMAIIHFTKFRY